MSIIKAIRHQLGLSVTPGNNFTYDASADNGTMRLYRGNAGTPIQDILTVSSTNVVTAGAGAVLAPSGPAFSAFSTAGTATSAVSTKINFQAEEYDTANCFDTTLSRFTPNVAGYYSFLVCENFTPVPGTTTITLNKNGSAFKFIVANIVPASNQLVQGGATIFLNGTTDFVEVFAITGNAVTSGTTASNVYFQGYLVRGA